MQLFKTQLFITPRKQYKNSKLKIIAPTWNDEFVLPDGSYFVPDIQDYIEYLIKARNINSNAYYSFYMTRINNRLVLQTGEQHKKIIKQNKKTENTYQFLK